MDIITGHIRHYMLAMIAKQNTNMMEYHHYVTNLEWLQHRQEPTFKNNILNGE